MIRGWRALALAAALAGCGQADRPAASVASAAIEHDEATHELGRKVYNFRCYFCHGYSGDARTVAAAQLVPPPADFTRVDPARLGTREILGALRTGRPGTAMKSFAGILEERELQAVAAFVRREFVIEKAPNTRYHTVENGWPGHERYAAAFPFATGELSLDLPSEQLDPAQAAGRRLFVSACITCHDRGTGPAVVWEPRAVSYPPNPATCLSCHNREGIPVRAPGASGRSLSPTYHGRDHPSDPGDPYSLHDRAPRLAGLRPLEREGERLYQANCAFCHAADGTGRNWIGSFLEPHPANFTDPALRGRLSRARIVATAREGIPGSSMPAWKSVLSDREIAAVAAYIERAFLRPVAQITRE